MLNYEPVEHAIDELCNEITPSMRSLDYNEGPSEKKTETILEEVELDEDVEMGNNMISKSSLPHHTSAKEKTAPKGGIRFAPEVKTIRFSEHPTFQE